jgi:MFS family permease
MQGTFSGFVSELRSDRAWRVVVASGVGYGLGLTVLPFYTLGSFVGALETSFGWTRAQVQLSFACVTAATLAAAWLVGWLSDRYGVRPVAAIGQVGLAAGLALLAFAEGTLAYWYGVWFLMSVVGLGTSPIVWTRGIVGWFDKGRGFALALALCGSGVVALTAPTAMALLIEAIGWRQSFMALAGTVLLIGVTVTLGLFPAGNGRPGASGRAVAAQNLAGLTVKSALGSFRFWIILASSMAVGFAVGGLIPNLVPLLTARDLSPAVAASFVGVLGASVIVGRIAAGYVLDRMWAPLVACIFLPLPAIGCLLLASGTTDYWTIGLSVMLLGFATGAEFDLVPYLCTRYFGLRNYGRLYALQWTGFSVTGGIGPAVFGHVFDVTGSYASILIVSAIIYVASAAILLLLGRYPDFEN